MRTLQNQNTSVRFRRDETKNLMRLFFFQPTPYERRGGLSAVTAGNFDFYQHDERTWTWSFCAFFLFDCNDCGFFTWPITNWGKRNVQNSHCFTAIWKTLKREKTRKLIRSLDIAHFNGKSQTCCFWLQIKTNYRCACINIRLLSSQQVEINASCLILSFSLFMWSLRLMLTYFSSRNR